MSPEAFTSTIRETFGKYPEGSYGCFRFARLLMIMFNGELYYNGCHCICLIGAYYYDLQGRYNPIGGKVHFISGGRLVEYNTEDFLHWSTWGKDYFIKNFGFWNIR